MVTVVADAKGLVATADYTSTVVTAGNIFTRRIWRFTPIINESASKPVTAVTIITNAKGFVRTADYASTVSATGNP
jgi:hypothetical protein